MALGKAPWWPVSQRAVCFAYLKLIPAQSGLHHEAERSSPCLSAPQHSCWDGLK